MKKIVAAIPFLAIAAVVMAQPAFAGPRESIMAELAAQAKAANPGFAEFSAARGRVLFSSNFTGGGEDTPSCTSCHGATPQSPGQTRAGKPIDPIAVSRTPDRFTDPAKVEKWFRRNCSGVLGRECAPVEKGDFLTFMIGQ